MMDLKLVLLWVVVVAVIFMSKKKEGFYAGYYKKYCPSCGWRSRHSCSKCTNCGYCVTSTGYGECVPGDSYGPYFREDCQYWEYGDPYVYLPSRGRMFYPHRRYGIRHPRRWRRWRR